MKAQVLITSTSASSALEVISMPRSNTLPSMISASTRFFAQPRLIIPTFGRGSGGGGRRVACVEEGIDADTRLRVASAWQAAAATEELLVGFTELLFANRCGRWSRSCPS